MCFGLLSESLILVGIIGYMNGDYICHDVCSVHNAHEEKQVKVIKLLTRSDGDVTEASQCQRLSGPVHGETVNIMFGKENERTSDNAW